MVEKEYVNSYLRLLIQTRLKTKETYYLEFMNMWETKKGTYVTDRTPIVRDRTPSTS